MKKDFDIQNERYLERITKRLSHTFLVEEFTPPKPEDYVILGSLSQTWRNITRREIRQGRADVVGDKVDAPTAHSRDYLLYCYPRRPCKKEQRIALLQKHMPIYVDPCILHDACYVDIKSAWWKIINAVGWDCEYWPGRWLGKGTPPADFPLPTNKVARSALVTIGISSRLPIWHNNVIHYEKVYNRSENLHLWGIVADLLQSIARIGIDQYMAAYVQTDGYIMPQSNAVPFSNFLKSVGLESHIKWKGDVLIVGAGCYISSNHATFRRGRFGKLDNIDRTIDAGWVLNKYIYCNSSQKLV